MVAQPGASIPQLLKTAKRLNEVKRMHKEFMLLWALDRADQLRRRAWAMGRIPHDDLADPANRDWRSMYRGSVLDD